MILQKCTESNIETGDNVATWCVAMRDDQEKTIHVECPEDCVSFHEGETNCVLQSKYQYIAGSNQHESCQLNVPSVLAIVGLALLNFVFIVVLIISKRFVNVITLFTLFYFICRRKNRSSPATDICMTSDTGCA